jgi:hypothetical protein
MTDRVFVYPGALPQDIDILNTNKFMLQSISRLNQALLGTTTVVAGLACTPTTPTADLNVHVDVGSIYQVDPTDASAYGSLGVDNINLMKQGISPVALTLAITPPVTAGFSQVYLIEAILNDTDAGATVLSYYNSLNPLAPFLGPGNSGSSNFTTRTNPCQIALKAGTPASTGTQTTPSPDSGFVGLYAVTVANGQTQITSGNIVQINSAPFFPQLPDIPNKVRNGTYVWGGTDTGAANAYVITIGAGVGAQAIPTAYVAGMNIRFKATNANSGASTVNVNGLGTAAIKRAGGAAVATGDILSGQLLDLVYDGVNFQIVNYTGSSGSQTVTNNTVGLAYVADSGTVNALIGTYSPAITSYVAGLSIEIKLANTITSAATINANGLGVKNILTSDLQPLTSNMFVAGEVMLLIYDGTQFQAYGQTSTNKKLLANTTLYVNQSLGSDSNDGSANVSGKALATIGKAVLIAWAYGPSPFTITIQVSANTYNESVVPPGYAGPNVIINGSGTGATFVNGGASAAFLVSGPNTLTVQNVTASNTGTVNSYVFGASSGASLNTSNTQSTSVLGSVFASLYGATVVPQNHTFSGSCGECFGSSYGGGIALGQTTFTFSTAISCSQGTCVANANGIIAVNNTNPPTFVNPSFVSGFKYNCQLNGVVNTNGLGFNFFPGSVAGTTGTGGQYGP